MDKSEELAGKIEKLIVDGNKEVIERVEKLRLEMRDTEGRLDKKIDGLDKKIDGVEGRLDKKIGALDKKADLYYKMLDYDIKEVDKKVGEVKDNLSRRS